MTGSLQTKKGKYYAVYREDNGKQRWVPLDLPVEGNNKRKAQKSFRRFLLKPKRARQLSPVTFYLWTGCFDGWIRKAKHRRRYL